MTDVTIHRSRTKAYIEGVSEKGKAWLKENMEFPDDKTIIIQVDYVMDLAADLQLAGLIIDFT